MSRGTHRGEGKQAQPDKGPAAAATGAHEGTPVEQAAPVPLSRRWQVVAFLWASAVAALALYELLSTLFRVF
jgi:hypothetical protein